MFTLVIVAIASIVTDHPKMITVRLATRTLAALPVAYGLVMYTPVVWALLAAFTLTLWAFNTQDKETTCKTP